MAGPQGLDLAPILRAAGLLGANSQLLSHRFLETLGTSPSSWPNFLASHGPKFRAWLSRGIGLPGPNPSSLSRLLALLALIQLICKACFGPVGVNANPFPRGTECRG